jgi:hypothetical protein
MRMMTVGSVCTVLGGLLSLAMVSAGALHAQAPAASAGQGAEASGASLTIADFEAGKSETTRGLAMIVLADEQLGGTSTARLTTVKPGAGGSRGALRIAYQITGDFKVPFDGVWALMGSDGMPTDLTAYKGLRFQARSKGGTFVAGVGQFAGRTALYTTPFEVTPEWTRIELPFDRFRRTNPMGPTAPDAPALVAKDVVSVNFSVASTSRGQFDLEIDQVEIYR